MKALLITPFWRRPNHLSAVRTERFIRWLKSDGWEIVLVRAGEVDQAFEQSWGVEIAIKDPLGLHPEQTDASKQQAQKQYSRATHLAAELLFNPDPGILWARRTTRHPLVLEHGENADIVLSSSPPESAHICAARLAKQLNAKLMIDMRDGWLDEPLKPLLRASRLQRTREGRLERRILRQADKIFVTSEVWKELLTARLPFTCDKVVVLTNCYPSHTVTPKDVTVAPLPPFELLHAGQFTGSKFNNRPSLLFAALLPVFDDVAFGEFNIVLQGSLNEKDIAEIRYWQHRFSAKKVHLITRPQVSREKLQVQLASANGLLLVSATKASLLAKLFEYLPAGRPILAVTLRGSAVWELGERIPQMYSIDLETPSSQQNNASVIDFLSAAKKTTSLKSIPVEFSEEHISIIFLNHLDQAVKW